MDLNQLNNLTPDQKSKYMRLERLFSSDGWQDVEAWAKQNVEDSSIRQLNAQNWEDNRVAYGARAAFSLVANLRETTQREFELIAEENAELALLNDEEANE